MTSNSGKEPFKEIEAASEWWTSFFRRQLNKNVIDKETISGWKLSLIPRIVGAAIEEKERQEQLAVDQPTTKKDKSMPEEKSLQRLEHQGTPTVKRALENFKCYLAEELLGKYKGHWYPTCRKRGNGYRCIKLEPTSFLAINPSSVDSVLLKAAKRAMIASIVEKVLKQEHCRQLRSIYMFINPGEVRIVRTTFGLNGVSRESKHLYQSSDFSLNQEEDHRRLLNVVKTSSPYSELNYRSRSLPNSHSLHERPKPALQDSSILDDTRSISPSSCTTSSAGSVLSTTLEARPAGRRMEAPCIPKAFEISRARSSLLNTANLGPPGF